MLPFTRSKNNTVLIFSHSRLFSRILNPQFEATESYRNLASANKDNGRLERVAMGFNLKIIEIQSETNSVKENREYNGIILLRKE